MMKKVIFIYFNIALIFQNIKFQYYIDYSDHQSNFHFSFKNTLLEL